MFSKKDLILREFEQAPEPVLDEGLEFVEFVKAKRAKEKLESGLLSESSLQKDWLKPEEDEAWRDL